MNAPALLVDQLDAALPQTQCTRCGYPDCRAYAQAIADGVADINQCPPGGEEGIARLARITAREQLPLNPVHGQEGPRHLALVDEAWCIGCTLCLDACPVDAIIGGPKRMHTVIDELCTGCELCIPVCPVDCISLHNVTGDRTGWNAWTPAQADEAAQRHRFHQWRCQREAREHDERLAARAPATAADPDARRSVVEAALARARARRPG